MASRPSYPARIWLAPPRGSGRCLGVKDLFDTAGLTTTYGSAAFADHIPERSAEAVARLERAGWSNIGKTNLYEFGYGITSENPHYGTVPNPTAPGRTAGGSGAGNAAALAAGLCEGALGTDSGGSIRIPAACCGIVGFKPTHGRVPVDGCFPLAPSFDHAGPMARSVGVCAEMLMALDAGFQPASLGGLEELRVAIAWTRDADALVRARVEEAAARFGQRSHIELAFPQGIGAAFMAEVAETHRQLIATHGDLYGENIRRKVRACLRTSDAERSVAARRRDEYRELITGVLASFDLLVTPTLPCVPHAASVEESEIVTRYQRFTLPLNAVGAPALAMPCGPAEMGLPASVQLIGLPGRDALVLAASELLERDLGLEQGP